MFLDSGRVIAAKIQELIDREVSEPVRLAVAFWGTGADYKLRGQCKIICDLESGACNPAVIRALRDRQNCVVLKLSGLHAKVVVTSAGAVVSSANMSTNGLGAEGADASGTIEAGYFVSKDQPEHKKIAAWFERIWKDATEITEHDLMKAQVRWEFRNQEIPDMPTPAPAASAALHIDPMQLLEECIDANDRLRAVRSDIFNRLKDNFPGVDHRRSGKLASWGCHLILNEAGVTLDHSAGDGELAGPATDQWIVSRFGTKKRSDTVLGIENLLTAISRDPYFGADIRSAASRVLLAAPWTVDNP